MKTGKIKLILACAAASMLFVACSKSEETTSNTTSSGPSCTGGTLNIANGGSLLESTYAGENVVIAANATVTMQGSVKIPSGCSITIGSGATIKAVKSPFSTLIIKRGATITAIGTPAAPIVFTSNSAVSARLPSDWGGVVIHGAAPVNAVTGINTNTDSEIFTGPYGGDDSSSNSGTLQYVRIEFAGWEIATGKEFNGLFLAGVGKGTTLDHIQTHRGSDDGIEIFGGTVDLSYLIISNNQDDGFDADEGWKGTARYVAVTVPTDGDQAIEYDGLGADASRASNGILSNFTMLGTSGKTKEGAISIRASGGVRIYNSYLAHFWGDNGVIAVATNSTGNVANVDIAFASNFVECLYTASEHTGNYTDGLGDPLVCAANDPASCTNSTLTLAAAFPDGSTNNDLTNLDCSAAAKLVHGAVANNTAWSSVAALKPAANITVTTHADPPAAPNGTDLAVATYVGAFTSADTWADTWTSFPAN